MTPANPYRTMAESGEPLFEAEPHALMALDRDEEPVEQDFGVPSVLMRAEDFTLPERPGDGKAPWEIATVVALTFAGVLTVEALLAWTGML